jgi:transcriptional regulator with XRE-family HTH domain
MIDYYERRLLNPTLDVMQKLAEALEISVAELLGEEAMSVRSRKREWTNRESTTDV